MSANNNAGDKPDRRKKYESKRVVKPVSFNKQTDAELLAKIEKLPDFSNWVKEMIRECL